MTAGGSKARPRDKRPDGVIVLPVFEDYSIHIVEWLSMLERDAPTRRMAARLIRSIQQTAADVSRVRNSARHANLAAFMQHAVHSLKGSEWVGARYILMMAHALMTARPVVENQPETGLIRQLPRRAAAANNAPDPATEIVVG